MRVPSEANRRFLSCSAILRSLLVNIPSLHSSRCGMSFPALLEILAILPLWILRHQMRLHSDNPYLFYDSLSFDPKSAAISRNCSRAASRSSTISCGDDVGVGQVGGVFQALVSEPEDVEADLVAADQLVVGVGSPAAVGIFVGPGRVALWRFSGCSTQRTRRGRRA